jgi:hypothetical protein
MSWECLVFAPLQASPRTKQPANVSGREGRELVRLLVKM